MNIHKYISKIKELSDHIKENDLELYKYGVRNSESNKYMFLLPKKELVDGKRVISEEEKEFLAKRIPRAFDKNYIEDAVRTSYKFAGEEEIQKKVEEIVGSVDKRYNKITIYDFEKDMYYKTEPLKPSYIDDLINGKAIKFYEDDFHTH